MSKYRLLNPLKQRDMRLRNYQVMNVGKATITFKKDERKYKSTYSVCFFSSDLKVSIKTTCPNRKSAKQEVIRLLKLYTDLTITQILKLK